MEIISRMEALVLAGIERSPHLPCEKLDEEICPCDSLGVGSPEKHNYRLSPRTKKRRIFTTIGDDEIFGVCLDSYLRLNGRRRNERRTLVGKSGSDGRLSNVELGTSVRSGSPPN
ncbi:hypothetical protein HZH66_007337 [Vespula vulgaris]|uniref:Uncharacterized protein n=1 Tax=Vespula vulgaris TaxID=7454 RepID=A0A834JYG4_VESVU|nr:hypothetical protein HZH66_007337 [Vespula vulgaris]